MVQTEAEARRFFTRYEEHRLLDLDGREVTDWGRNFYADGGRITTSGTLPGSWAFMSLNRPRTNEYYLIPLCFGRHTAGGEWQLAFSMRVMERSAGFWHAGEMVPDFLETTRKVTLYVLGNISARATDPSWERERWEHARLDHLMRTEATYLIPRSRFNGDFYMSIDAPMTQRSVAPPGREVPSPVKLPGVKKRRQPVLHPAISKPRMMWEQGHFTASVREALLVMRNRIAALVGSELDGANLFREALQPPNGTRGGVGRINMRTIDTRPNSDEAEGWYKLAFGLWQVYRDPLQHMRNYELSAGESYEALVTVSLVLRRLDASQK